ncbi:hypothetical protein BG004_006607 [Podila humilis]|nr:hypothetical protein BG004_006607 [Podila humilis]
MGLEQIQNITPDSEQRQNIPLNGAAPQTCSSKQLRVFFLVLYIFCMLRSGNVTKSNAALSALHAGLDETRPKDEDELRGIFKIALRSAPRAWQCDSQAYQQDQQDLAHPSASISVKWMSFSQVYCLTYLLSGMCSKADMTQPSKSLQFLTEGIKAVDREFNVNDCKIFNSVSHPSIKESAYALITQPKFVPGLVTTASLYVRSNQKWFTLIKLNMLLQLSDVQLLNFDHAEAEQTLLRATSWCQLCGIWDTFKWRISLSIGMLMHLGGKLDEALTWYGICTSHTEDSQNNMEGYDIKSLALVNAGLIYCGDRHFHLQKVKAIQLEVKSRYSTSTMTPSLICALHILDSWTVEGLIPARQHLQESLRLSSAMQNSQLKGLTLLLLGNVYVQTHDDQAEKILKTGYLHALKTKNLVMAAATGSSLKDLYFSTSQGIKSRQQAQHVKAVTDVVDEAFQSTPMAPLVSLSLNSGTL